MTLNKQLRLTESKSLDFRLEAFNVFNHTQFYGPASVDGEVNDPHFGQIVRSHSARYKIQFLAGSAEIPFLKLLTGVIKLSTKYSPLGKS